jgi:hypothetical protein
VREKEFRANHGRKYPQRRRALEHISRTFEESSRFVHEVPSQILTYPKPGPIRLLIPDRTLIEVFERFGRFTLHQTFDRFADMIASLEGGGTEARQWFAGLAVGHHGNVADGKDSRMVFNLKVGTDRDPPTVTLFHDEGLDDRIRTQAINPILHPPIVAISC